MRYNESHLDEKLRRRFANDMSHAQLRRIVLKEGSLRGITSLDISLEYPISAIAGRNGSGKSTLLALASCAFHNEKSGYKLPKRKTSYYTFSDFFVQHSEESKIRGVELEYHIAHQWKKSTVHPGGPAVRTQRRHKKDGGKWNDYDDRVTRNVVFLGIDRIVPHSERSQSRSYSKVFADTPAKGWEDKVRSAVGYVLCRSYDKFRYVEHSKYSLPIVQVGPHIYSGFNMGAGENALFEIFSTIYSCGRGALLVLDEVELGLHAEAQRRFVERLKEVCLETNTQVICTTHSREIFDCLPPDARFFIECVNNKTQLYRSISSDFAFSKMSAVNGIELDLLVEDDVGQSILAACLPASIRSRVEIQAIGSASALARQLAALHVRGAHKPTLVVYDGDQRSKHNDNRSVAKSVRENPPESFSDWYDSKVAYVPGDTWPESWLLSRGKDCVTALAVAFGADEDAMFAALQSGIQAAKHSEFFAVGRALGLEGSACRDRFTQTICREFPGDFEPLVNKIKEALEYAS